VFRLVLFDFDGTLADTLGHWLAAFNELAPRYGMKPVDDWQTARRQGSMEFLRNHNVSLLRLPFLLREFFKLQRSVMDDIRLFEGLETVLPALARVSRLGVVSSNHPQNIRMFLETNGVADLFESVIGIGRIAGKDRAIAKALARLNVEPSECLYVGDEIRDVEAAHLAGVHAAAVLWGVHPEDLLREKQPQFVLRTPADLLEVSL
jgi:phosphoglycolate phosphatase